MFENNKRLFHALYVTLIQKGCINNMAYLHLSQANPEIIADQYTYWASKTPAERKSFAGIVDYDNRFKDITPTQTSIGSLGGATVSSGKRWLYEWKKQGLIESQHRKSHKKNISKTCRYALHSSFRDRKVREQLSTIPEFALVFKMTPIKKMIVPPYAGRRYHNIKVLLSVQQPVKSEATNLASLNYELHIKSKALLGTKQLDQSAGFQASQTCQIEKPPSSASSLPGYDPNMTKEEKIAYVLARSAEVALQKKEQPKQQTMPSGLSSYEQGQWLKSQLSTEQKQALQRLSRERLESGYIDEVERFAEKERREMYRKQSYNYN